MCVCVCVWRGGGGAGYKGRMSTLISLSYQNRISFEGMELGRGI